MALVSFRRTRDSVHARDAITSGALEEWTGEGGVFQEKYRRELISSRKRNVACVVCLLYSSQSPAGPLEASEFIILEQHSSLLDFSNYNWTGEKASFYVVWAYLMLAACILENVPLSSRKPCSDIP